MKNLSSAVKMTATRLLLDGACVNLSIRCVRWVGWKVETPLQRQLACVHYLEFLESIYDTTRMQI